MRKLSTISLALSILVILFAFRDDDDFVSRLQARLRVFYETRVPVKLHVLLNQSQYVPGDTLLYKITLVTEVMNRRVEGRQVVHINLVDQLNVNRFSASVLVNHGTGAGALALPSSLPSGLYMLNAYHGTMLNANEPRIFQQPLLIGGGDVSFIKKPISGIEFFPESGNVVAGVTNRIAVHAPPLFETSIFENETVIAHVQCDSAGWGDFYFVPGESKNYYYGDSVSDRNSFSVTISGNISMLVSGVSEGSQLRIAVHSSQRADYAGPMYLVFSRQDEILFSAGIDFRKKKSHSVSFPKNTLHTGVYALTLFTENGDVVSERLLYVENPAPSITISTNKDVYNVREPVTLSIAFQPGDDSKSMAVNVYQEDIFAGPQTEEISFTGYFNRTASLPDATPGSSLLRGAGIDRFMISQKRRNFSWKEVWSGQKEHEYFFEPYQRLTGKAFFKTTGEPVPDSTFIQFFFETEVAGYQSYTRDNGRFSFPLLFDFYDEDAVHFIAESKGVVLDDVKIIPEEITFPAALDNWTSTATPNSYYEFMKKKQVISAAFDQSKPEISTKQVWLNERIETIVDGVDATFTLSDYVLLPTMHETLREIVVSVKSRENKNLVRVWLADEKRDGIEDPLYVIDGVLTNDTEFFLSLNPADVVTIKVINTTRKLDVFGGIARNGVILIDTRIAGHELQVPRRENVFSVTGLTKTKAEPSAQERKKGWREPDLRSNLYWNPDVKVINGVATVTFDCADNTGKFRVVAQGLTTNGQVLAQSHSFTVSFKGH